MIIKKANPKLNSYGFGHIFLPLIVIVGFAIVGTFYLVISHADSAQTDITSGTDTADSVAAPANCSKAKGPFKDKATEVIQGNGRQYIPYGITTPGLAHADFSDFASDDSDQIQTAATSWCANTVRLQVSQDELVGADGKSYSADFMAAIKGEVAEAENLGLVVVINAQTEDVGKELGPTNATRVFWKDIVGVYGNDPQVVFDIFNEPRVSTGSSNDTWKIWRDGGRYQGVDYLGMQQIADDIRSEGANNLLWIEGPGTADTLDNVSSYPIRNDGPIMYAIHHPEGSHNSATWYRDFGYLVKKGIAPVVVGEWTNYASSKSECWNDAPSAVPAFLNYLQNHNIGMTAWTLRQGVLAASTNLSDPTRIQSNWACKDNINGAGGPNEGAGNQIMHWFIRQNS